jgi:putative endonuclease
VGGIPPRPSRYLLDKIVILDFLWIARSHGSIKGNGRIAQLVRALRPGSERSKVRIVYFMKQPCVYILQSVRNGRFYIGSTDDMERRLYEHNTAQVKATKFIVPLDLKAQLPCKTLKEAREAEYRLKRYKNRKILEKLIVDCAFPWEYQG